MDFKGIWISVFLISGCYCSSTTTNGNVSTSTISPFTYRCHLAKESESPFIITDNIYVGIQTNRRITSQLLSRIFGIFLREILHIENISFCPFNYHGNISDVDYESKLFSKYQDGIRINSESRRLRMMDLDVWLPLTYHKKSHTILEAGSSITAGRFGWFIQSARKKEKKDFLQTRYTVFEDPYNKMYRNFTFDEATFMELSQNASRFYESKQCLKRNCVTLIAQYFEDTAFIMHQIEEMNLYINVLWLGENFKKQILWLNDMYETKPYERYIVLHWKPSELFYNETEFYEIELPNCENFESFKNSNCKYEMTPVLKLYAESLKQFKPLQHALLQFNISDSSLKEILKDVALRTIHDEQDLDSIYNEVACNWLKRNTKLYDGWIYKQQIKVSIGGIFPQNDLIFGMPSLFAAAYAAVRVINKNSTILKNFELQIYNHDDECRGDLAMKTVIQYFETPMLLGILGPPCSKSVESIAGISKHLRMPVMSYSAEGTSFENRNEYPYFFKTIGSNRQYVDVYMAFLKEMGWNRAVALTEVAQNYTEYISHMENQFRQNQMELTVHNKFSKEAGLDGMIKILSDFKEKHARIIITDVPDYLVDLVICASYKLKMTAKYGYIWFFPSWVNNRNKYLDTSKKDGCTQEDVSEALDGHFSLRHTPFGDPNTKMQEGILIKDWVAKFSSNAESNYIGFVYDAVWSYALAADKLFSESPFNVFNLRNQEVVEKFAKILHETKFYGLSGDIKFNFDGTRITDVDVMQWRNSKYYVVGRFKTKVKEYRNDVFGYEGGNLALQEDSIVWLTKSNPGDGRYDCFFSFIIKWINQDCESAAHLTTYLFTLTLIFIMFIISFYFWKYRYHKKFKRSARIMKNFGVDILSPLRSNLNNFEKLEIAKENVIVKKILGEGAFGAVYGGEAKIGAKGWTDVAVKTLKTDASVEDRLDFLSEAEAMKRFHHKNIVKLLGVCLQSDPIYTIMEYMLYGDLKTYLVARKHLLYEKLDEDGDISSKRLTSYVLDIARGLEYLVRQKYVHRDIACRNCLVNAEKIVKIGDFGMSRSIYGNDYYRFNRKGILPVRWMAPEALALGYFTPASDIWSFGVVLYEVITFGAFPFKGLTNNQVVDFVKSGGTLKIPFGIKPQLEGLIKACWSDEPKKRPTADEVVEYISNNSELITPYVDFNLPSAGVLEEDSNNAGKGFLNFFDYLDGSTATKDHNLISLSSEDGKFNPSSSSYESITRTTPEGYSIMCPLLKNSARITSKPPSTPDQRK